MQPANATAPAPAPPAAGTLSGDLAGLWALLLSFGALRDWFKLIVLGGALETLRRLLSGAWASFVDSFFITAHFEQDDETYEWMMVWLSKHPAWAKARDVQISTKNYRNTCGPTSVVIDGEEDDGPTNVVGGIVEKRRLAYLPSFDLTHSMWFHRHWLRVTRSRRYLDEGCTTESLKISVLSRDHRVLNQLLLDAKRTFKADQQHRVTIYIADQYNNWRRTGTRPKRPLRSIILDPGVKEMLLRDAREFMASEAWYAERGIPFRRGYLLHGAPGSGKTSLIHAIAGELGLDIFVISLSKRGLDDSTLNELIADLPAKSIALMEDIDAAFHHGITREPAAGDGADKAGGGSSPGVAGVLDTRGVTLSGLLGAIDGVAAHEGRLLFATTNHVERLDPALSRPGRMDVHVEFRLASAWQARELFRCFYPATEDAPAPTSAAAPELTITEAGPEHEPDDGESDEHEHDAEDSPPDSSTASLLGDEPASASASTAPSTAPSCTSASSPAPAATAAAVDGGAPVIQPPRLPPATLAALAERFARAIPERELSMAALQGHLMGYKTRPAEAVADAPAWVERERAARRAREAKGAGAGADTGGGAAKSVDPPVKEEKAEVGATAAA